LHVEHYLLAKLQYLDNHQFSCAKDKSLNVPYVWRGMVKSTFAGKSTEDTIRNYAEMLIDDLNSNLPENAFKHWDKAREIDNQLAKDIFGDEYSIRIGEAYYNCLVNFKHGELGAIWSNWWDENANLGSDLGKPLDIPGLGALFGDAEETGQESKVLFETAYNKFFEVIQITSAGLIICPKSADIHAATALIGTTHLLVGTDFKSNDEDWIASQFHSSRFKDPSNIKPNEATMTYQFMPITEYKEVRKIVEKHIGSALKIQPQHPAALEAKEILEKIDNWEAPATASGCFIATAAYGTPLAEEIDVLRNWRDDFLEASYPGRAFIKAYYSLSPPVADNISESEGKRKIVRTTLSPIVKILKGRYSN